MLESIDIKKREIICFYEGELIHPKCLVSDKALIVLRGLIVIYLEDETGKKEVIDFKASGESLKLKHKIDEDKINQLQGMILEYTEISVQ